MSALSSCHLRQHDVPPVGPLGHRRQRCRRQLLPRGGHEAGFEADMFGRPQ